MTQTATSILLGAEAPRVLTIPMIKAALADKRRPVARRTLFKWIRTQTASGVLRPVTRGLYLNQLARPTPTITDAAGFVRSGAIVSLQTVLGEAGITNSYSDIVTSVLPIRGGSASSSRPVRAAHFEFRFHAMPVRLLDENAGKLEDRMDFDVHYPRATLEKALLDWIYLGASRRTRVAGPPLDIDLDRLDRARLARLARCMELVVALKDYVQRKRAYDRAPDVRANAPVD